MIDKTGKDDIVLRGLVMFERIARAHRYGGRLHQWQVAASALSEYRRRVWAAKPRQMTLEEAVHDS
ncbi:MAG: hypothetical protein DRH97_04410 [Chloroflexi bacterium]|nr:MAG: hypothetical protein DRH97_04410 [Chloroflexota bacterium]